MARENKFELNGRKTLKLAGTGVVAPFAFSNSSRLASASSVDTPKKNWKEKDKTGEMSEDPGIGTDIIYQSSALVWYGAAPQPSGDGYVHDFSLATTQICLLDRDHVIDDITKTEWEMSILPDSDDWHISPKISKDYSGVAPKNNGEAAPDWLEIPFDVAVGALHPVAAAALVADDLWELTKVTNDLDETSDGWKMTHKSGWGVGWTRASHVQRFTVEVPENYNGFIDHLEVKSRAGKQGWGENGTEVMFSIGFGFDQDDQPDVSSAEVLENGIDAKTIESSPEFTAERTPVSSLPRNLREELSSGDGTVGAQSSQEEVMYITDWPLSVSTKKGSTNKGNDGGRDSWY